MIRKIKKILKKLDDWFLDLVIQAFFPRLPDQNSKPDWLEEPDWLAELELDQKQPVVEPPRIMVFVNKSANNWKKMHGLPMRRHIKRRK